MNPFKNSRWITSGEPSASPIFERKFELSSLPKSAKLFVTGLGFFEARVNGTNLLGEGIGAEYFQPVVSDWERRSFTKISYPCSDSFTHRIYYRVFDVAELLKIGENSLEIQTGGGWYVQNERITEGYMSYSDKTKCVFSLKLGSDGSASEVNSGSSASELDSDGITREINSDGSESWRDSEIVWSNLFVGEVHDPTASPRSGKVELLPDPDSELSMQIGVPDRLIREIEPKLIGRDGEKYIFDAGENISGLVKLRTREGWRGELTLRFAENVSSNSSSSSNSSELALDFASTGGHYTCRSGKPQIMTDRFVCDGSVRDFLPKFTWHSFRYFEVEGEFDSVRVEVIHSDVAVTAEFDSDCEGFNFLFDAYVRTQLDNMHGSIPSDCPHRERLGYTGDGQICAPTAMLLLDSREFYRKWIIDILDCQDRESGHVQHTAPFQGGGGGPGGWGCAIILVPYYFLKQFGLGELELIRRCYEPMKKWIGYLRAHSVGSLVTSEVEGGWCLGDWATLEKCRLPEPFVNSFYLVKCLRIMRELASLLNEDTDIPGYSELEGSVLEAIKREYFDSERGVCFDGTQGADAFAAALGLTDASIAAEYYDRLGHFDTGFLCTDVLCELLFERGYGEFAYKLLSGEECGSYLYMKRRGATTVWENWGGASHNHPMFGAPARQLFSGILGIRQPEGSYGWERVEIKPFLPSAMSFARGSILTPRGRISVTLVRENGEVRCSYELPEGEV